MSWTTDHIDHENAVSFHQRFDLCNSKHENGAFAIYSVSFSYSRLLARFEYETFMLFLWRNYEIVNARRNVDDIRLTDWLHA